MKVRAAIIKQGEIVKGLTTAASLWAVSCIGLTVGSGFYEAAILATAIVCVTLILLSKFEKKLVRKSDYSFELCVEIENKPGKIGGVTTLFGELGINIRNIVFDSEDENFLAARFMLQLPKGLKKDSLFSKMGSLKGITLVKYS